MGNDNRVPKITEIPVERPAREPRVVVPFVVVEHEGSAARRPRIGILVIDPAVA